MEEPLGRMRRINELLHEEIATLLRERFSRETVSITVTKVECDPDLRHAHVYYSVITDDKGPAVRFFRKESAAITKAFTKRVILKRHPQLHFVYDESLRHLASVDRVLNTLAEPIAPLPTPETATRAALRNRAPKPTLDASPKRRSSRITKKAPKRVSKRSLSDEE